MDKKKGPKQKLGSLTTAIDLIRGLETKECLVSFSAGADSMVVLDLCVRAGVTPSPYFWYLVPGLEMFESVFRFVKLRYGIEVDRFPGPNCAAALYEAQWRPHLPGSVVEKCPQRVTMKSVQEAAFRRHPDSRWTLFGHRLNDSFVRRGMLTRNKGVDTPHEKAYPVWNWNRAQILGYLKQNRLPIHSMSSAGNMAGLNSLSYDVLTFVRDRHPKDYAKILRFFPYAEAAIMAHDEKYGLTQARTTPEHWKAAWKREHQQEDGQAQEEGKG